MHASSLENMTKCYRRYIAGGPLEASFQTIVLDVGGADASGTYREVFAKPPFRYRVASSDPGPGVDVVLHDPYRFPLPDGSVDIVISGQALAHIEFFWRAFEEMVRVVRPEGFIFLILPLRVLFMALRRIATASTPMPIPPLRSMRAVSSSRLGSTSAGRGAIWWAFSDEPKPRLSRSRPGSRSRC
jgi:SAM-dependent methyltransferase